MSQTKTDNPLRLQEDFQPVSTEAWESVILKDLKGADYNKKLVWQPYEGLTHRPYYRAEDLASLDYNPESLPGEFPYVRGFSAHKTDWGIRQDLLMTDITKANEQALAALMGGATEIGFHTRFNDAAVSGQNVTCQADFAALLKDIHLEGAAVHFNWGSQSTAALIMLLNHLDASEFNPAAVRATFGIDPLAELLVSGRQMPEDSAYFDLLTELGDICAEQYPQIRPFQIDTTRIHEAGGSLIQQTAAALSQMLQLIDLFAKRGRRPEWVLNRLHFVFPTGSDYFLEIARLRAFRLVYSTLLQDSGNKVVPAQIHCQTSLWNKTLYDPYVNLLRATTEAMSAVIGGTDSLSVLPHDALVAQTQATSLRLARNIQIILAKESKLGAVIDPSAGSYLIENLTQQTADKIWELMRRIDEAGGLNALLASGAFASEIQEIQAKKETNTDRRKDISVGVNQYPNLSESLYASLADTAKSILNTVDTAADIRYSCLQTWNTEMAAMPDITVDLLSNLADLKAFFQTAQSVPAFGRFMQKASDTVPAARLPHSRKTEKFEQLRWAAEEYKARNGKAPQVMVWMYGDVTMRNARSIFVSNLLGAAGYELTVPAVSESTDNAIEWIREHQPNAIVFCSSDPEYAEKIPELMQALKPVSPNVMTIVAGYPKDDIEALKAAGIEAFVHVRTNAADFISASHKRLGVTV